MGCTDLCPHFSSHQQLTRAGPTDQAGLSGKRLILLLPSPVTGPLLLSSLSEQGPQIKPSFLNKDLQIGLLKLGDGRGVTANLPGGASAKLVTEEQSGMGSWQIYGVDTIMA